MRKLILIGFVQILLALALGGCGGGSSIFASSTGSTGSGGSGTTTTGNNVVAMTVDQGPNSDNPDADTPFITITVCAPGSTTNCEQISNIEVDTGSYGLRIISSALPSSVTAGLTQEDASNNAPLVECTQFIDGIAWGPVMLADVQIGGESASNVPIQVIGDSNFPDSEIPSTCLTNGSPEDTVAAFGANGIIGVGPFAQDCGSGCTLSDPSYAADPSYFSCPSGSTSSTACAATGPELGQQVINPVVDFTSSGDDNGVIVELPSVPDPQGAATATGSLVFGIGTQSNNALGSVTVLTGNDYGDFTTTYNGASLQYSFLDTGSNAYYFDAGNTGSLPDCTGSGSGSSGFTSGWLCPTTEQTINLTNEGANYTTSSVSIKIYNADTLFDEDNGTYTAFDNLGADTGSQTSYCNEADLTTSDGDCYFDYGLPFFFGRNVYVAIAGYNTSGGEGPYFAY